MNNDIRRRSSRVNNNNNNNNNNDKKKKNIVINKRNDIFSIFMTIFYIINVIIIIIVSIIIYFLIARLGFGKINNNNNKYNNMKPIYNENVLEIVCELDIPPGNIAVNREYRTFFNYHPEYNPNPIKIIEMINFNSTSNTYDLIPYPSLEFQDNFITVLSLRIDINNILWLLDFAQHGILGSPKLYGFQLYDSMERNINNNDFLKYNYTFPNDIAGIGSFLNDFQVDPSGDFIYITIDDMIIDND